MKVLKILYLDLETAHIMKKMTQSCLKFQISNRNMKIEKVVSKKRFNLTMTMSQITK